MVAQLFEGLFSREPTLVTALFTLVGGFTAQVGPGHIPSTQALGTSVTVSGLQGLLTRTNVFSPASFNRGGRLNPLGPGALLAQGAEPALSMSVIGTLVGFLVQVVGGHTNLLQALGIAGGLAVTQGVVTRPQVFSPRTVALARLNSGEGVRAIAGDPPTTAAGTTIPATAPVTTTSPTPTAAITAPALAAAAPPPLAPGDLSTEAGRLKLLARYRPVVRYDSMESYYADSAAVLTDRPGNLLLRADGTRLAPGPAAAGLKLDLLKRGEYVPGVPVEAGDYIKIVGTNYAEQAREMHARPGYGDKVHGRVVQDSSGTWWLQYWFVMYYDNPNFLGFGTHEGDIEMIQLRLDAQGRPEGASYSQHRSGIRAAWAQLETAITSDGIVPVTYSARGSHANLPRSGTSISTRSFLPDHNDGRGYRVRPDLIVLSETATPWSLWPGSWGGSRASGELGQLGIYANSPGPLAPRTAWTKPDAFHSSCAPLPDDTPPPGQPTGLDVARPPAPALTVEPSRTSTVVRYTVPHDPSAPAAAKIVASLAPKDPSIPAHTVSADITSASGTVELPQPPPGEDYEVRATVHTENGVGSATQRASM